MRRILFNISDLSPESVREIPDVGEQTAILGANYEVIDKHRQDLPKDGELRQYVELLLFSVQIGIAISQIDTVFADTLRS